MKIENPAEAVINLQARSFKELMHRRVKVVPSLMGTDRCEIRILWLQILQICFYDTAVKIQS